MIKRDYDEQFYMNKLENPENMDKFLETSQTEKSNQLLVRRLNQQSKASQQTKDGFPSEFYKALK